jgi:hypothetical protein
MQQKDVIYIDVEDDITAIIGKVKDAKESIVALVPPKRTGVLQSAVNLRLLARAAEGDKKKLVLITGNQALSHLAANAKIPVAKNLQSRPEIAEMKRFDTDDEDDVIDGEQLPVSDHMKAAGTADEEEIIIPPTSVDGIDIDDKPKPTRATAKTKKGIKVPDFGSFRKRLALGVGAGILLILFLIWANVIAPHATIVISAKTSPVNVKTQLTIGDSLQNSVDSSTLTSLTQTDKTTATANITPSGTKNVGTKASGTVIFSNCQDSSSLTVNAGTYISSGSSNYIVQSTVVVPGGSSSHPFGSCTIPGKSAPVQVVATDVGSSFNVSAGASFTVAGFSSQMTATSSAGISGGDSHQAKVMTADDVQNAINQLKQNNTDGEKKKLKAKFQSGVKVIDDSLTATTGNPNLTPGIGDEVTGSTASMSIDITYSIVGVAQASLEDFMKSAIGKQVNTSSQRIFDSGVSSAQLSGYQPSTDGKSATIQLTATGQVGPKIDDNQIKQQEKGKRAGEVQGDLRALDGVSGVQVNLSPFWVTGVPNDINKITVQFKLLSNG